MQSVVLASSAAVAGVQRRAASQQLSHAVARPAVRRRASVAVRAEGEAKPAGLETQGPNMKPLKDIQEIMDILPHR
jgi:hypothetical protein